MSETTRPYEAGTLFRVGYRGRDDRWEGLLQAYWEVSLDPMSDDYTPEEIGATELLKKWADRVTEKYLDHQIPIWWFVECELAGKFESMPFQYLHGLEVPENFLTFYDWPIEVASGEPVNWLRLPVVDKLWKAEKSNKGGFIQEATGWKPSPLQPSVYLPSLLSIFRAPAT